LGGVHTRGMMETRGNKKQKKTISILFKFYTYIIIKQTNKKWCGTTSKKIYMCTKKKMSSQKKIFC
jgi:diphthamide biosynthesis methyltransferase